jgi:predicted permease
MISSRLWKARFAASPAALGKTVTLDGVNYTLVGVAPPGFSFGLEHETSDIFRPIAQGDPIQKENRAVHNVGCVARLNDSININQAQAEMNAIQESVDQLHANEERGLETKIFRLSDITTADVRGTVFLLFGAVGIVLLIACANVANLLLARSSARSREFAIRAALGGNRVRIVRQLMTESVLLSLAGGLLGLAVAEWSIQGLLAAFPGGLPRSTEIGLNSTVLLFALGISMGVGVLFGLAPALKSSIVDLHTVLKQGSRGSTSNRHRVQNVLVVSQMALTLVLLVSAGLLFRTIRHLWQLDPGLATHNIISFKVGVSPSLTKTPAITRSAYQQLLEGIQHIPGVQVADLTTLVPLSGDSNDVPFWITPQPPASIAQAPRAVTYSTGPDYLRVMGIPLLQGRFISAADTASSSRVVVIDSVLARTYFPGENPIGQVLTFANPGPYRIVGVVGHVQHWGLGANDRWTQNQAYTSFYQIPDRWIPVMRTSVTIVIRTPLSEAAVMPAIKQAVDKTGTGQPIYDLQTIQQVITESMSTQRFPMVLLVTFAALALLLASVGIYGVISYSVNLRVNEIGIRVSLGAERRNILRMIIGQGLRLVFVGLVIGALAASFLTRLLSSLLFGVSATDAPTFASVAVLLVGVALLACWLPARRAMRADPLTALRYE